MDNKHSVKCIRVNSQGDSQFATQYFNLSMLFTAGLSPRGIPSPGKEILDPDYMPSWALDF